MCLTEAAWFFRMGEVKTVLTLVLRIRFAVKVRGAKVGAHEVCR